ncbi:unnamed protein product [Caenorhabditis angaria]|uniref:Uncharacterized protein n=1 Tax=Caenorhabditis angaria TaxID=860376 RepID=A0A9P1MX88_9PELO|nr:unnamed protein product [Caenorhabditis angaria]
MGQFLKSFEMRIGGASFSRIDYVNYMIHRKFHIQFSNGARVIRKQGLAGIEYRFVAFSSDGKHDLSFYARKQDDNQLYFVDGEQHFE